MEDMDLGLKRPSTLPFTIMEKLFMVMGEVAIGLVPSFLPTVIPVAVVYCWSFLFIFMRELNIGIRSATLLHIAMVYYTLYTQGFLNKLFQGEYEEKIFKTFIKAVSYIHIKTILVILIQSCHHTLIQTWHHALIQACYHTLFVSVHIVFILLFMHIMEFRTIIVYHP